MNTTEITEWARSLPKVELHRHLEGAVRLTTVLEEGQRHGLFPKHMSAAELKPQIQTTEQFADLASLLSMFDHTQAVFKDMATLRRIAFEAVMDASEDGIRAIELRYAPSFCSMHFDHPFDDVLLAIQDGVAQGTAAVRASGEDIAVGLLCIGVGAMGYDEMAATTAFALSTAGRDAFVGFDMAGTEDPRQFEQYAPLFHRVRDSGMKITCHASEDHALGFPENAVAAVDLLGASRVGHGIQIHKSAAAMEAIRNRGVMLEVSVSSNYLTNAVACIEEHPVRKLYDYGIPVCVNTDDPGIMDLTLTGEHVVWYEHLGFSCGELANMNVSALAESFIGEEDKRRIRDRYFSSDFFWDLVPHTAVTI